MLSNGTNKVDLDAKLLQVEQAQNRREKQQRAGEAKQCLSKISKAFSDSEPKALQMADKTDSLKPGAEESFDLGMSELDSLARQLAEKRQLSPESQSKQAQEALNNLQTGMRKLFRQQRARSASPCPTQGNGSRRTTWILAISKNSWMSCGISPSRPPIGSPKKKQA